METDDRHGKPNMKEQLLATRVRVYTCSLGEEAPDLQDSRASSSAFRIISSFAQELINKCPEDVRHLPHGQAWSVLFT